VNQTAPLRGEDDQARIHELLVAATAAWGSELEHQSVPDERGHWHWLVRQRGEERDHITIWFSLRQRSVRVECEVIPAPDHGHEAIYQYCLTRNAEIRELHLALGPERGIYLVAHVPAGDLDAARLDELVGACATYVDEMFPTLMSMAFPGQYRRRRGVARAN
jgi:hypothetical protein